MSKQNSQHRFLEELDRCVQTLDPHLLDDRYSQRFQPVEIREAATMYVRSGGKRLRPAILLWSCGAVGGDIETAIPAAAAVEIFHTWTLVHDDIIDRDALRRGNDTVHSRFQRRGGETFNLPPDEAKHYGASVAILAGDVQHGWNVSMLTELTREKGLPAELTLALIREINNQTINGLIEGELLDLQYTRLPAGQPSEAEIESMLRKKTGELYRFCAWAGSLIGLGKPELDHPYVAALSEFALRCGQAFQMQDDILSVIGDPGETGKAVGNDLREGKRTLVLHAAWELANEAEKEQIRSVLGNHEVNEGHLAEVNQLLVSLGAVDKVRKRALEEIESALPLLEKLPESEYRELLGSWGDFMVHRNL